MAHDRYSQFVASMRWLLPMFALIVAASLFLWPILSTERQIIEPMVSELDQLPADSMTLEGPRYIGHTNKGEKILVTAVNAEFDNTNEDLIKLSNISGKIDSENPVNITADTAIYDRRQSHITLQGQVTMTNESGYTMVSDFAEIDMNASIIQGSVPISINGPVGRLDAENYAISRGGADIHFGGRVNTTIKLK